MWWHRGDVVFQFLLFSQAGRKQGQWLRIKLEKRVVGGLRRKEEQEIMAPGSDRADASAGC